MCKYDNLPVEDLYCIVFDVDGAVRPCGRDACKALIQRFVSMFPGVDFGNQVTGQMRVGVIQEYAGRVIHTGDFAS